jgi:hypothetical protein
LFTETTNKTINSNDTLESSFFNTNTISAGLFYLDGVFNLFGSDGQPGDYQLIINPNEHFTETILYNDLTTENLTVEDTTKTAVLIVGTDTTDNLDFAGYFTETTNKTINSNDTLESDIFMPADSSYLYKDGGLILRNAEHEGILNINADDIQFGNRDGEGSPIRIYPNSDSVEINNLYVKGNITIDGTLDLGYDTLYYSIHPSGFCSNDDSKSFRINSGYSYEALTDASILYAPVNLPHGAKIIEAVVYGDDATEDWYLQAHSYTGVSTYAVAQADINTVDNTISATYEIVDNQNYNYFFTTTAFEVGDEVYSAVIKFRIQK